MDICGYIYLYDSETNRQDIMKITVYGCKNVSIIDDTVSNSEFMIDKNSLNIISSCPDFSVISYSMLTEIASTALELDKKTEYPSYAVFDIDISGNPYIKFCNSSKEIFPVPYKTDVYLKHKMYLNITEKLTGNHLTSVLKSSLYAHHLNFLALRDGIVSDKLFCSVCGRVFLNATYLCKSAEGAKIVEKLLHSCANKDIRKQIFGIPESVKIKRNKISITYVIENSEYTNPYHRIITTAVSHLPEGNVFDVIFNSALLRDIVDAEVEGFESHFDNLLWQGVVSKIDDLYHASCDDLLSISAFSYGRDMLKYHIENNRKFYNYHKTKNIICISSDGQINIG